MMQTAHDAFMRQLAVSLTGAVDHQRTDYTTHEGIIRFCEDVLGVKPTRYQGEILEALVEYNRVAVRAPHGAGKTALSSWFVLWLMTAFPPEIDTKVVTTASAWRQVKRFTWAEIRQWSAKADWSKVGVTIRRGKELLDLSLRIGDTKQAFAVATDTPALIEGAHATLLGYVFDEAKAIPAEIWDATEGAFSNVGNETGNMGYSLAISTPAQTSGRFYDIHQHKAGYEDWHTYHITLKKAIESGRISESWVEARARQWGRQSAIFKNRVEGEFAEDAEQTVVPLSWVEQAQARYREWQSEQKGHIDPRWVTVWGVDPADTGSDETVIIKLQGNVVTEIKASQTLDLMKTAGYLHAHVKKGQRIGVDVIGVGAGVKSRLLELNHNVLAVNVSKRTDRRDSTGSYDFFNLRSYVWWLIREAIDPNNPDALMLPPDDKLAGGYIIGKVFLHK
jgi:hypothetical protein